VHHSTEPSESELRKAAANFAAGERVYRKMARLRRRASKAVGLKAGAVTCASFGLLILCSDTFGQTLPDAPGFLISRAESAAVASAVSPALPAEEDPPELEQVNRQSGAGAIRGMEQKAPTLPAPKPCVTIRPSAPAKSNPPQPAGQDAFQPSNLASPAKEPTAGAAVVLPICENPVQLIVTESSRPLTSREKGLLAIKDFIDPFNLLVLTAGAGFSVAANPNSAYGPGFEGWGKLTGYSLIEDAQGEFIGTYMISSLAHEDPRYHRMPQASVKRRISHAVIHTLWTQHDNGSPMLNLETLLTYPASAELSNLYVPGVQSDAKSTARRVGIGLATDPVSNLIAEFLPDVAKRIHVRVVFMQQILNQVANGAPAVMTQ
jgi:hypothetical protein